MIRLKMFFIGCVLVCVITMVVNVIFKKKPEKADKVIDYILFSILTVLLSYAIVITDWEPVEEKLSKDLKEYRETQRNMWKFD